MPEYHVATSDISGAIYAGIGDKQSDGILWGSKSEVTNEVINAVIAHMLYRIQSAKMDDTYDKYSFAYANKIRDGRYLRLKLEVADAKPSWHDEDGYEIEYSDDKRAFIKEWLSVAPSVDAVPVRHSYWTTRRTMQHDGEWYCAACEYEPTVFENTPYCAGCGAKMDGGEKDG